jgi:hypothetical protein
MAWGASVHPPEIYHRVTAELDSITLGCELLLVGFIEGTPRIYQVQEDGSVVEQAHFAAIGRRRYCGKVHTPSTAVHMEQAKEPSNVSGIRGQTT